MLELHLNELDELREEGFDPQLLWTRGESFETARDRLRALAPDASAGRASRDTVHPLVAEVEKLVPRPARQEFSVLMWAGWLDAKLVDLPEREATNPVTRQRFRKQWSSTNPRFRAAHAVGSYFEHEGIEPLSAGGTLYSEQREVIDEEREYWRRPSKFTSAESCCSGRCSTSAKGRRVSSSSSTRPHASRRSWRWTCAQS